jgi:hypothetical protein
MVTRAVADAVRTGARAARRQDEVRRVRAEAEGERIGELERLGYAIFVFVNARNVRLNVLSRRRDGVCGLIEPVVGGEHASQRTHVSGTPH